MFENIIIIINSIMKITCDVLDWYIDDINKNKNINSANTSTSTSTKTNTNDFHDINDNDLQKEKFDFNPLIESIICDLEKNIIKYVDINLYKLDKIKIFIGEFNNMAVLKNKRKISNLELFYKARKIVRDFEVNVERIRKKGLKEKNFIKGFNSHLVDVRKYFDNLTLFISMYHCFNISKQEDFIYKIKLLNYSISYAKLINSIFETMADIYPNEMGWLFKCSTDLVNLIQSIKKFKIKYRRGLNRFNKMKPIFLHDPNNKKSCKK